MNEAEQSAKLSELCLKYKIKVSAYGGHMGGTFYEAVSDIDEVRVRTFGAETKMEAVEDVVWKLENGWGKVEVEQSDTPYSDSKEIFHTFSSGHKVGMNCIHIDEARTLERRAIEAENALNGFCQLLGTSNVIDACVKLQRIMKEMGDNEQLS